MSELFSPSFLLLGLILGAIAATYFARAKRATEVEAAAAKAAASAQGELSELRERVRAGDEARRAEQGAAEASRRQGEAWRDELDRVRDEVASLTARVSRVPALEDEIAKREEVVRANTEDLRRQSEEIGKKSQAVALLEAQCDRLDAERETLQRQLLLSNEALGNANERKATLEQQAARLESAERALVAANVELDDLKNQLAALRETNSAEVARYDAEKTAHALNRIELAEVKHTLSSLNAELTKVSAALNELRETHGSQVARLTAELNAEREAYTRAAAELNTSKTVLTQTSAEAARLTDELTELRTRAKAEQDSAAEKLALLEQAKVSLSDQFKSLANDILEEKSKRFAEQNQASLGQLLTPLKTQLTEFKGKVEEVYIQEGKERTALAEQVRHLVGLNQTLSQDAQNLTRALKGDVKMQGNWGELVLERVLETAGLMRGREYDVQESQKREDGSRGQADVVVRLPEERHLVIDSKVSLIAYEAYVTAETDEARAAAVSRHLDSVRSHIKGLSSKQYQTMYGIKQLDFVLLFVPIEPAFMLASTNDSRLFMDAWEKNVLLVSPSTLLFVVRTVAHLWRQEAQTRNAQDIAKRGAELYDKLSDFVKDLTGVGERLRQAQDAYDSAHKRLTTGKGNVIRQAEMLRSMGVKPSKKLVATVLEQAMDDDELQAHEEIVALARANTPSDTRAEPPVIPLS